MGNNIPDQTANDLYNNYTVPVVGATQRGDLRFIDYDGDGVMDHVQTITTPSGHRVNASGGPENTIDNPGVFELLTSGLPVIGEIRRVNW